MQCGDHYESHRYFGSKCLKGQKKALTETFKKLSVYILYKGQIFLRQCAYKSKYCGIKHKLKTYF